jgi:competence ComEA-like helix-hairpin-helix protein
MSKRDVLVPLLARWCGSCQLGSGPYLAERRPKMKEMTRGILALLLVLGVLTTAWAETGTRVDLNSASQKEFESLPGIGPALAKRIVEHRAQNGDFRRVEELMNVKGIGEKKFLRFKDLVYVKQADRTKKKRKN